MVSLPRRIEVLSNLGTWLEGFVKSYPDSDEPDAYELATAITKAHHYNQWIIEAFVLKALSYWAIRLSASSLEQFVRKYPDLGKDAVIKDIAVIPEENMPLAGFHDFICVLLSGNRFVSLNANHREDILWFISTKIISMEPGLADFISWHEHLPQKIDKYLVHAKIWGSTTWREYLQKKNSLIRNQRIAVAVITSEDQPADFELMGSDIFEFFGQSPHNVRKLYVPEFFTIESFFPSLEKYDFICQHNRYANNYDYQRSVLLMDQKPFFENGFLVMREAPELVVPIGCLYFERYFSIEDLQMKLQRDALYIQQIISKSKDISGAIEPGKALMYSLEDFEDGKDTLNFLTNE